MYRGTVGAGLNFPANSWQVVLLTGGGAQFTLDSPVPHTGESF